MAIVAFPYAQRYSVLALLLLGTCVMSPLARAAASDVAATGDAGDQPAEIDSGGDGGNDSVDYWIWVHGILMSVGWVALLPLGALLAQSRWLAGLRSKVANKEAWFWAHMGCQVLGVLCVTAGFAIAYRYRGCGIFSRCNPLQIHVCQVIKWSDRGLLCHATASSRLNACMHVGMPDSGMVHSLKVHASP